MVYKLRKDVVLAHVCGAHILVTLRPAWGEYPFAMQISPVSAFLWESFEKGASREEIESGLQESFCMRPEKAETSVDRFISYCLKKHYFLPSGEAS